MDLKKSFYVFTHWEKWHYHAKYIPLYPAWIWYTLRSGSLWWFTPSNPTLTFGGFEGESKKEMYGQLPPSSYPKSIYVSPSITFDEAENLLTVNKLNYPFAVKPDVGMMGFMFRKIDNAAQFKKYHSIMPVNYIMQDFIQYPIEVSVFYYRFPNKQQGNITGFIKKEMLHVKGDGTSTLLQLIIDHPEARFRVNEMSSKHAGSLHKVIPQNEVFFLSLACNLSRGGKLVSIADEKGESLLNVFDEISHHTMHFYYGRYDIKCASIQDLKEGKNFSILEYNGCGAEPHHVYGNGHTLLQAYQIILHHWKVMYKISRHNRKAGIKYWKHYKGFVFLKNAKKHFKILKQLDAEFVI